LVLGWIGSGKGFAGLAKQPTVYSYRLLTEKLDIAETMRNILDTKSVKCFYTDVCNKANIHAGDITKQDRKKTMQMLFDLVMENDVLKKVYFDHNLTTYEIHFPDPEEPIRIEQQTFYELPITNWGVSQSILHDPITEHLLYCRTLNLAGKSKVKDPALCIAQIIKQVTKVQEQEQQFIQQYPAVDPTKLEDYKARVISVLYGLLHSSVGNWLTNDNADD
jgi:hypothetical protein